MIFLVVFALGSLIACWIWSEVNVSTKIILTLLYVSSWGCLFIPFHARYLFPLAQSLLAVLFGAMAFGIDWLMKDVWRGPR